MFASLTDPIKLPLAAAAGAFITYGLLSAYNTLVHIPEIKAETRRIVEAESEQRTKEAINAVTDLAERARAMRRFCSDGGKLYDFEANRCRDA